jgi:hypothetical protein
MSPSLISITRPALKSHSLGPLMLVFTIPALILPMTANAFDIGSLFGVDINAINKCNSEVYDRMELDEENEVMVIYLKNGSTMTTYAKTGEVVIDGEYPEISAECQKVYAEMEDSPFYKMANDTSDDKVEYTIEKDGDRTAVTAKVEEEEDGIDIAETAEKITDGVMKGLGKWFD